jgi:hypothetical protein
VWPITTTPAAQVLKVSPANLRRWIREGKFEHIDGMTWERRSGSFQNHRLFTKEWVLAVAALLETEPDFSLLEGQGGG